MNDLEINIKNWAEEVIEYYSTKISILILDKEDAIDQCTNFAFNKIPKYEDYIAEGKKPNTKGFLRQSCVVLL